MHCFAEDVSRRRSVSVRNSTSFVPSTATLREWFSRRLNGYTLAGIGTSISKAFSASLRLLDAGVGLLDV